MSKSPHDLQCTQKKSRTYRIIVLNLQLGARLLNTLHIYQAAVLPTMLQLLPKRMTISQLTHKSKGENVFISFHVFTMFYFLVCKENIKGKVTLLLINTRQ